MQPEKSKPKTTFSKSIMGLLLFLYFIGFAIATILVLVSAIVDIKNGRPIDSSMFVAYAAYLGGPTATAIGFYAWKSKAENIIKISQSVSEEHVNTIVNGFTNMGGN